MMMTIVTIMISNEYDNDHHKPGSAGGAAYHYRPSYCHPHGSVGLKDDNDDDNDDHVAEVGGDDFDDIKH